MNVGGNDGGVGDGRGGLVVRVLYPEGHGQSPVLRSPGFRSVSGGCHGCYVQPVALAQHFGAFGVVRLHTPECEKVGVGLVGISVRL